MKHYAQLYAAQVLSVDILHLAYTGNNVNMLLIALEHSIQSADVKHKHKCAGNVRCYLEKKCSWKQCSFVNTNN